MNGKTIRLLRRYALREGLPFDQVKALWLQAKPAERAVFRKSQHADNPNGK